jgi:hypothetical protein
MRKASGIALTLVLLGLPTVAAAQQEMGEAKHEFGVDLSFAYLKPSGGGDGLFSISTPVDLRVGFIVGDKLVVEPRFRFNLLSGGGSSVYTFTPDLNFLMAFQGNKEGPYVTAGAGVDIIHAGETVTQFNFNGGIGTRTGAARLEAFVGYHLEKDASTLFLPSFLTLGVRIGLSFWH